MYFRDGFFMFSLSFTPFIFSSGIKTCIEIRILQHETPLQGIIKVGEERKRIKYMNLVMDSEEFSIRRWILVDLSLLKATFRDEMKTKPAMGPAIVDK
ncbi:hypothetical protein V6N13_089561 [Hibiscus sabdariffa]